MIKNLLTAVTEGFPKKHGPEEWDGLQGGSFSKHILSGHSAMVRGQTPVANWCIPVHHRRVCYVSANENPLDAALQELKRRSDNPIRSPKLREIGCFSFAPPPDRK